jgi:hypothetical protein
MLILSSGAIAAKITMAPSTTENYLNAAYYDLIQVESNVTEFEM